MTDNITAYSTPFQVLPGGMLTALGRVRLEERGQGQFNEAWLQNLIHADARCLPLDEIEPGLGPFLPVCRELRLGHGYVDNFLISPSGDVAIVETKLWRNPEARREVLAQALDYAVALFALDYETLEATVLKSAFGPRKAPKRLYDLVADHPDALPEPRFIDAVNQNLRRGRAMLIVAGDGIRSETSRLLEGLNQYAQFQFTLALVEMAVYRLPDTEGFLVQPRLLARTQMLVRQVFEVEVMGGAIAKVAARLEPTAAVDLTTTSYWETLERNVPGGTAALQGLLKRLEPYGVYGETLGSFNLKWQPPDGGKPANLGYFHKNGVIYTDASAWNDRRAQAVPYVHELAEVFGADYAEPGRLKDPTLYQKGKPLRLSAIMDRLDRWEAPARRYIESLRRRQEGEEAGGSAPAAT